MITAYAVTTAGVETPALLRDKARADDYAAACHGTVHELVEKAAILRKFDAYVPADQASSMRFRIVELEEIVRVEVADRAPLLDRIRELKAQVAALQEELGRKVLPAVGWREVWPRVPACWCTKCDDEATPFRFRMNVCPQCGDKRCPRAEDHEKACHVVDAEFFDPVADAARTMPLGHLGSTAEIGEAVARYAGAEVVTDPARIEAIFEADAAVNRAMADMLDDQCDGWAGLPMEDAGLLS